MHQAVQFRLPGSKAVCSGLHSGDRSKISREELRFTGTSGQHLANRCFASRDVARYQKDVPAIRGHRQGSRTTDALRPANKREITWSIAGHRLHSGMDT